MCTHRGLSVNPAAAAGVVDSAADAAVCVVCECTRFCDGIESTDFA